MLIVGVIINLIGLCIFVLDGKVSLSIYKLHNSFEVTCEFPRLDPWDPSIYKYIWHEREFKCPRIQPYLTYIDDQNFLHINRTEADLIKDDFFCSYATFEQSMKGDNGRMNISKVELIEVENPKPIDKDYVFVQCKFDRKLLYENVHATISNLSKEFHLETEDQLSVLMILIDSTSLSMFRRNLPRTYELIADKMGFHVFQGYSKVADNTFPNILPLLTGKRVYTAQSGMEDEFKLNYSKVYYDDFPLIFKEFSAKGYVTVYNEDKPEWGLFNYLAKGFKKKPTDHYMKPFWTFLEHLESDKSIEDDQCFHNVPKVQLQLDIVRRSLKRYAGVRKFIWAFFVEISHNDDNSVEMSDDLFANFLETNAELLNKTVVILASDHGHRFSAKRKKLIGQLEERMPMFSIRFPSWFHLKYPQIKANLRVNQWRLSSHFDTHETLLDIVNSNYGGAQRNLTDRGLSQLYELPANRTCISAGIPDFYCICAKITRIPTENKLATQAGLALVKEININLSNHSKICAKWKFKRLLHAENYTIPHWDSTDVYIQVAVQMSPKKGMFQAVMKLSSDGRWSLQATLAQISRLDAYGSSADCLDDKFLQIFCRCINKL